jgi:hypothetical protein
VGGMRVAGGMETSARDPMRTMGREGSPPSLRGAVQSDDLCFCCANDVAVVELTVMDIIEEEEEEEEEEEKEEVARAEEVEDGR